MAEVMEDIGSGPDAMFRDLWPSKGLEGFLQDRGWVA